MDKVKKNLEECKRKKLIRSIDPRNENSTGHIEKAEHYLKALDHNIQGEFQDIAVTSAFYAHDHALLALLQKQGYEARAQECAINAVQYLILNKKVELDMKYIDFIRLGDKSKGKDAKTWREEVQYGVDTGVNEQVLAELKKNAKESVEVIESLLYKKDNGEEEEE